MVIRSSGFTQIAAGASDMDVMVMDVDRKNEVNFTPEFGTEMATQPAFSPDGTQIAFSSRGGIPNGREQQPLDI